MLFAAVLLAQTFVERPSRATQAQPVTLVVDATRAGDGLLTVHERIPANPGDFTIVYPQWIPGEHGPTGPLNDLAALRDLSWRATARLAAGYSGSVRLPRYRAVGGARRSTSTSTS